MYNIMTTVSHDTVIQTTFEKSNFTKIFDSFDIPEKSQITIIIKKPYIEDTIIDQDLINLDIKEFRKEDSRYAKIKNNQNLKKFTNTN